MIINADILREVILKANDALLWGYFRSAGLMDIVLPDKTIQKAFTKQDNHDIGDSSLKIPMLPVKMNKYLFGDDNYEVQKNHNQLVRSDRQIIIVRGAEILLIDF